MFRNLARLVRYRGLIQSLVARELKARYRGSVLGFFWSFINPLLLLLVEGLDRLACKLRTPRPEEIGHQHHRDLLGNGIEDIPGESPPAGPHLDDDHPAVFEGAQQRCANPQAVIFGMHIPIPHQRGVGMPIIEFLIADNPSIRSLHHPDIALELETRRLPFTLEFLRRNCKRWVAVCCANIEDELRDRLDIRPLSRA